MDFGSQLVKVQPKHLSTGDGSFPSFPSVNMIKEATGIYDNSVVHLDSGPVKTVVEEICKHPYFPKQCRWLAKHRKSNKRLITTSTILEKPAETDINKIILTQMGLGNMLRTQLAMPAEVSKELATAYEYQFYQQADGYGRPQCSPLCTAEVRLILDGHEVVLGFAIKDA